MEKKLICEKCRMAFRSAGLLEKHKDLFCIGSDVGDLRAKRHSPPTVLKNNGGGIDPKQTRTPDIVQTRGQRRTIMGWRGARTEPESGGRENKPDGAALQNLTDEFHKLRTSIEEKLRSVSRRASDAELSDSDVRMSPRTLQQQLGHSERLKQMREMATLHQRQLALIHIQHQQLEQQRDELAHRVSVLSEQSNATHLERLLTELREQEERNEETLQHLREHLCERLPERLHALNVQQVSVSSDQPESHKSTETYREPSELRFSAGGPLSAQIKALRQAYLQSGGSIPAIVEQMIDLQAKAQSLESNQPAEPKAKNKKVKPPQRGPSWELLAVEQENQRLEEEILRIQMARDRHAAARTEHELIQREIFSLHAEIERPKAAPRLPRQHPSPPHPAPLQSQIHTRVPLSLLHTRSIPAAFGRHMTDSLEFLGSASYDPVAGFVLFFDMVMGLDASHKVLRVVATLHSDGHEVRLPALTAPVQCQLGEPHGHRPGNYAVLSVKQPVHRIQPSPSVLLVVEVQAAKDPSVHNQDDLKLAACGWTQLELFDQYNQLHSGYWRMPVHNVPIKPLSNLPQLNTIPKVGNMELLLRLVNGRDEDAHTLLKPDPTTCGHYQYPAVVSSLLSHGNAALPVQDLYPVEPDQLSSPVPITVPRDSSATHEASHN